MMAYNFWVYIHNSPLTPLLVTSATFPTEVWDEDVVYIEGRPVPLPTKPQTPGQWSCKLNTDVGDISMQLAQWFLQPVNPLHYKLNAGDIVIALTDPITRVAPLHIRVLKDAWLKTVETLSIDWSNPSQPVQWSLNFRYSRIKTLY